MAPIPITRAEYQAKFGALPTSAPTSEPTQLTIGNSLNTPIPITRAEYAAKFGGYNKPETRDSWSLGGSISQALSGLAEGAIGTAALGADLVGYAFPNQYSLANMAQGNYLPLSSASSEALNNILPKKEDDYRYARTIGNFLGGNAILPGGSVPRNIITSLTGAVGAQSAEDLTGNKTIAPIVGGALGGSAPGLIVDILGTGANIAKSTYKRFLKGSTPEEIRGSAALALSDLTDLAPEKILTAIENRPKDRLGAFMTTAELTDDAGMAQIEKSLSTSDEGARLYNQRAIARNQARDEIVQSMSRTDAVNKEGLGTNLINKSKDVQDQMLKEARNLWEEVPRNKSINIEAQQAGLQSVLNFKQGGLNLNPKVSSLVDQLLDPKNTGKKTSGALQDIRSDALRLKREANLSTFDERVLNTIDEGVDAAMERGLKGKDYDLWKAARNATASEREVFGRSAAGGAILSEYARPSNVLSNAIKGDTKSIVERC
jgi:hypothetical protein